MKKSLGFGLVLLGLLSIPVFAAKVEVNSKTGTDGGSSPFQTLAAAIDALRADPAAENEILITDDGPHFLDETLKIDVQVKIAAASGIQPIIVAPFSEASSIITDPFLYVQITDGGGVSAISITPVPYTTVELDGLTIIPLADENLKQQPRQTAIIYSGVDFIGHQAAAGAKFIMKDCIITSNNGHNVPSSNTGIGAPLSTDTVFGGAGLELGASGFSALDPENGFQEFTGADLEAYDILVEDCLINHCWVYGINISAEKVTIKNTDIMYNGMRGIQNIHFENDFWQSVLIAGSPEKPAKIRGNGYVFAADGSKPGTQAFCTGTAIRMFGNQVIDFAWLDIVDNFDNVPIDISSDNSTNGANIRSMDHVLIANNGGSSLITTRSDGPTFATGLAGIPLTISNCTFIGTKGSAPSTGSKSGSILFYAGTAPVTISNSILGGNKYTGIVLGAEDLSGGTAAAPADITQGNVTVEYSALIGDGPFKLGAQSALGSGRKADEIILKNVIAADPQFAAVESTSANSFVATNSAFKTAGPNGVYLTGARPAPSTSVSNWPLY